MSTRERAVECNEHELLGERHARHHLALGLQAERDLLGPDQEKWLHRLDSESDNLRAALSWSIEHGRSGDPNATLLGLRIASTLHRYWYLRGYLSEGREWLAALLTLADRVSAGGDASEGLATGDRDSPLLDSARADAYCAASPLALFQGDLAAAQSQLEVSVALAQRLGDAGRLGNALSWLGNVAVDLGDVAHGRQTIERSVANLRGPATRGAWRLRSRALGERRSGWTTSIVPARRSTRAWRSFVRRATCGG